jgi:tryptophan-rich sensory protein
MSDGRELRATRLRETRRSLRRPTMPLSAWLALCLGGGALMGLEFPPGEWHRALIRPSWSVPDVWLAPIFAALYALIAVAAWRVDRRPVVQRAYALRVFLAQLALNFAWLAILMGAHALGPALAVAVVLWLAIVATVVAFAHLDRTAALLMVPWLIWIGYAVAQNFVVWLLN